MRQSRVHPTPPTVAGEDSADAAEDEEESLVTRGLEVRATTARRRARERVKAKEMVRKEDAAEVVVAAVEA